MRESTRSIIKHTAASAAATAGHLRTEGLDT